MDTKKLSRNEIINKLYLCWNRKDITIVVNTGPHETTEVPLLNGLMSYKWHKWDLKFFALGFVVVKSSFQIDRMGNEFETFESYKVDNIIEIKEGVDEDALLV